MNADSIEDMPRAEVLVIGAGMAGGAITCSLAEAGVDVVCLEQGQWIPGERRPHADRHYELRRAFDWSTSPNRRRWETDYPIGTPGLQPLMLNAVGGSTAIYTAAWPRFRPSDFVKDVEHGLSPNWPYTYEDLEPYYDLNDADMGASGLAGDPGAAPRSAYPNPPLPLGKRGERFASACERLGWHWWPFPMAVNSRDYRGRPACNYCGDCQSGCPRDSLAGSHNTYWPRAVAAGADLRTGARVERILTGASGEAIGAIYVDRASGRRYRQLADLTVVCCNGIGTPRLLLNSASERHPNGLANSSDQVGRNLMFHGLAIVEVWTDEIVEPHKGVICAAAYSEEFAETDAARGFVNGFTLLCCGMNGPGYQAAGSHSGNVAPWGDAHHEWFERHYSKGFAILVQSEDLPHPDNRVTLDPVLTDSDGIPAPYVHYELHPNDEALLSFACDRAVDIGRAAGAHDIKVNRFMDGNRTYLPPAWHLMGTARMGTDPTTSVTDATHQAWDVPNLYICDGSSFPTGGAVNPTSTIGAMALKCADGILQRLGKTTFR
ncbi:GMC family oxidoreductase [Pseudonocardia hispaniensis]|uniref:GMC family oxidoreductase n=1 Tax=Pseudonocardia hispaniensis TaxID=904933 RepID=A0ABW1J7N7_9PSEU